MVIIISILVIVRELPEIEREMCWGQGELEGVWEVEMVTTH